MVDHPTNDEALSAAAGRFSARVHDDSDAEQADEGAEDVGAVGVKAVEGNAPQQRPDDEHAAVGGEYAPELVAGLQGGDHAVGGQCHRAERDEGHASVFLDAEERIRGWAGAARHSLFDVLDAYAACWTALRWAQTDCGAPARRSEVSPPLEVLGEDENGRVPREEATGLLMRMVV